MHARTHVWPIPIALLFELLVTIHPPVPLTSLSSSRPLASRSTDDSTWGMMLCAEWGVRSGVVPPALYERFMDLLDPSVGGPSESRLSTWLFRCFETRAVHKEVPALGCFMTGAEDRTGVGFSKAPAWDPFYLIDRTVGSLFLAGVCFLYLSQGVLHACIGLYFLFALRDRVKLHGLILSTAMQQALAEAQQANGGDGGACGSMSDSAAAGCEARVADADQLLQAEEGRRLAPPPPRGPPTGVAGGSGGSGSHGPPPSFTAPPPAPRGRPKAGGAGTAAGKAAAKPPHKDALQIALEYRAAAQEKQQEKQNARGNAARGPSPPPPPRPTALVEPHPLPPPMVEGASLEGAAKAHHEALDAIAEAQRR